MFPQSARPGHRRHVPVAAAGFALMAAMVGPLVQPATAGSLPAVRRGPAAAVDSQAAAGLATPSVAWTPCRDGFQCATVRAPLDYDNPGGDKVSLSVIRRPAAVRNERIGSLMVDPGGPGVSGVDFVRELVKYLPPVLRARFDVVGFDPRGVRRSTPVRCFTTAAEANEVRPPFTFPVTPAEEQLQRRYLTRLGVACARHAGAILAHVSTADAARDMDFLRGALGDQRMSYWGLSYGSMLGQTYANLFPDKVRAMVIDGVIDPRRWVGRGAAGKTVPLGARLRSDVGAQKTLNEFFRLCDQAGPAGCALAGSSARRYAALAARLRAHPQEIPGGTVTYALFVSGTLGALHSSHTWPDAATFFADLEKRAKPAVLARDLAILRSRLGLGAAAQEPYPNVLEGKPAVACSDANNPDTFTAWTTAAARTERQHGYFGRPWTWSWSECLTWPKTAGQDRYVGPWTARTARPVLVVGNYFDPATHYGGAVAASQLLPRSRLLTYAGWGHVAYLAGNFCVDRAVTRYLVTVRTPAAGKVCRPEGSPFGPGEAVSGSGPAALIAAATLPEAVRRALSRW